VTDSRGARSSAGKGSTWPKGGHPVVAGIYDAFMLPQELLGLRRQRARTAGEAVGTVLELGVGTGLNLPFYADATRVVAIDPDPHMLRRARRRAAQAAQPVELVEAGAESLPFEDGAFDTVVVTLTLCTVPDPAAAVAEARRVLTPDGRFLFLEHVRSDSPWVGRIQDSVTPAWKHVSGGCHWNRTTVATIEREFEVERLWRRGIFVQGAARRR
jgi:ubiquinone/menaquinone biosynthesis C-methylase UbiE